MTGFYEGTNVPVEPIPHFLTYHEDVELTNVEDKQILQYDAATYSWINVTATGGAVPQQVLDRITQLEVSLSEAQTKLINLRAAFVGVADAQNASPPQMLDINALLDTLGIL